ncbi:MAG TPA: putative toxin-antitoxin system toxin component, PIN family [Thermodesulfobacteriota bacterium]|nr:putative toxin-antitoxin system toxin component, PIN family [Thermodesulfobacteriota bacterium]
MGKKQEKVRRVVLDTNVLVSALLFKGSLSRFVQLWRRGKIIPVISKETFEELTMVLHYPKFSLSKNEIESVIEHEILPYFEVVEVLREVKGVCRDPGDDKFISCALSASADCVVSGDKEFCDLRQYKTLKIVNPADFLRRLG